MKFDRTKIIEGLSRVVQRMHYPLDVMLVCVRWYSAYPLSFRQIEEMMAERLSELLSCGPSRTRGSRAFFPPATRERARLTN